MSPDEDTLRWLAKTYMDFDGQITIDDYLDEGAPDKACVCILASLDVKWHRGELGNKEASFAYEKLDLDPEFTARIRTKAGRL